MTTLWQACLASPPYSIYTYEAPADLPKLMEGQRVLVPLGRSVRVAFLIEKTDTTPENIELKSIIWPLEKEPLLNENHFNLYRNIGTRQMQPLGKVLENVVPKRFRSAKVSFKVADRSFPARLKAMDIVRLSVEKRMELVDIYDQGRMNVSLPASIEKEDYVSLTCDPPWPVRPNAARQLQILEYIYENGPREKGFLKNIMGDWTAGVIKKLHSDSLVKVGAAPEEERNPSEKCSVTSAQWDFVPSRQQEKAIEELNSALDTGKSAVKLLHGITGSGKTLVYMTAARKCMEQGRSVILLVPEIALAYGLWNSLCPLFPDTRKYLYHGYQTPVRKEAIFRTLAEDGKPALIVGTRSALFLPVRNPGLIIIDEEHDESYKQEERLPYQAKEVAYVLSRMTDSLLVLGSATPDIKTFYAGSQGAFDVISMGKRVGKSVLPKVKVIDTSSIKDPEKPFAPETEARLKEVVEKGEQAVIMLNRRGFSPLIYCTDCEEPFKCPHCNVSMTYHKARERVICHYCGNAYPFPLPCSTCGGSNLLPLGGGTERLEEQVAKALPPDTRILRMDRDSTRRQEKLDEILKSFAKGNAQVLVGTQMLSKGHNFPGVTLVVVAEGDLGLNLPDYRSAERTFQLLVQVSGRAGRGDKPGEVLIQTRNPDNPIWGAVTSADYKTFFEKEIEKRRRFRYPPFTKLTLIRISHPLGWEGENLCPPFFNIIKDAAKEAGIMAMGPVPAPLSQLKGRKRFNCLLKSDDWMKTRKLYAEIVRRSPDKKQIRITMDLDPVNML
ncbi:replication restart helicase PriA [Maridesulfovibrio hydrothermalis]|uniref:Replication restart protein PriA n=1 Tax=Maridesulfovibrio hydrothermalis AM13 = DSM 14728 TaxID=1121451 RepID=L0RFY7_9BACT|nr:primosomal protein N' [Maridesulfovibrio hydrothermalis]CCO24461.1 Primosomal protein N' [Maridesulfovibrio hydrothermalis AM13 = DSM 14728]